MTAIDLGHLNWPTAVKEKIQTALTTSRMSLVREGLREIAALPDFEQLPKFKLGIVRSFTLETQVDLVNLALSTIPTRPQVKFGDFGSFETLLWDPHSEILANAPDAVLVLWRLEDLYPELAEQGSTWSQQKRQEAAALIVERVRALAKGFCQVSAATLFLSTMPDPTHQRLSAMHLKCNLKTITNLINQEILELAAENPQICLFDFAGWCARQGHSYIDDRMDLYARQPISAQSIGSFSLELAKTFGPLFRARAKVFVLDLDNTLWGGILGEDGVAGLKIGHDYPGNVYRQIQIQIKQLKNEGILLALASKNDLEPVKEAFSALPEMILQWDDFVCTKVDWNAKHQNIKAIADQLQLGLDSFVFIDDNHMEREEVKHFLPQVNVLPVTHEPLSILNAIKTCSAFDSYRVSNEDYRRSELYALQQARSVESNAGNVESFLFSLEMQAKIEKLTASTCPRAVQMLQKTNQFNLTTRRHNEACVRDLIANDANLLFTLELEDRFGSQGIVALLIAIEKEPTTLIVDSFLMSCRVIGRGVEDALWAAFVQKATERGYKTIAAQYIKTEKNGMVSDVFTKLGMQSTDVLASEHFYEMQLPAAAQTPAWIKVKVKDYEQSGTTV